MGRWLLLTFVIAGLVPLTWLRSPPPYRDDSQSIMVSEVNAEGAVEGEIELLSAWHLRSTNRHFGSYSALVLIEDGKFLAASDRGRILEFAIPQSSGVQSAAIARFAGRDPFKKQQTDLESLVHDPQSGRFWAGFEGSNTIERLENDFSFSVKTRPKAMQNWASNSGPESMVRLKDGRFIVISEGQEEWGGAGFPALLFARDPVLDAKPVLFQFSAPDGFRPVDMTGLPDGRVLVLVRDFRLGIPPSFHVKLVVADPAEIDEGVVWSGHEIGAIVDPNLSDNYEGMAISEGGGGASHHLAYQ